MTWGYTECGLMRLRKSMKDSSVVSTQVEERKRCSFSRDVDATYINKIAGVVQMLARDKAAGT